MKALIIGATGLVGSALLEQLLQDNRFMHVTLFVRRSTKVSHPKLTEHIIDFEKINEIKHLVTGDVLFSALGTTIKTAGSKENQYRIDHHYQFEFAKAASENSIPNYVLVSSAGANEKSGIFYNRMKGELERDIRLLKFKSVYFIRPSLLAGERKENRTGEKIGYMMLNVMNKIGLMKKYKPIHARIVAKAMINAAITRDPGITVAELDEVFKLAAKS